MHASSAVGGYRNACMDSGHGASICEYQSLFLISRRQSDATQYAVKIDTLWYSDFTTSSLERDGFPGS